MTIADWLKNASQKIDRLDAELLLTHHLGAADRSYLVAHSDEEIYDSQVLDALLERRVKKEPLAYIIGHREFYGRNFFVTPDVLIPRPESEDIIELAKSIKPSHILDVGTGSGCLAVTLALELPNATVSAIDISDKALRVAQKNAARYHAKINFHKSDLLADYKVKSGTLIVANLPYVDRKWEWLDPESLNYEPSLALYAEKNGLGLIWRLIDQAPNNSQLIIEADPCQHQAIIDYAKEKYPKFSIKNYIISLSK